MTEELIANMMEDLNSTWPEEVQSAKHALSSMGKSVVPHLLQAIELENEVLREHCVELLKGVKCKDTLLAVIELFEEEQPVFVLEALLSVLIELMETIQSGQRILQILTRMCEQPTKEIRLLVLEALALHRSIGALQLIEEMSEDSELEIRAKAEEILSTIEVNQFDSRVDIPAML